MDIAAMVETAKRLKDELKIMSYSLLQKTEIENY